jgi:hypothetical protein
MEKFKTKDVYAYCDEKDRRLEIYNKLCDEPMSEDPCELVVRCRNLDKAYLDWCEGVILEKQE